MRSQLAATRKGVSFPAFILAFLTFVSLSLVITSCGGTSTEFTSGSGTGTVRVSLSDPPSCKFPVGDFKNVWVTIRSVQAHVSPTAGDGDGAWQELAPNLADAPMQLDLMATPQNSCVLAQLGVTEIPVGAYQQIRLLLVANNPAAGSPVPSTNACGSQGFNCAVLSDDSIKRLELSSQANTGLKIPPGQIVGGPITVEEGETIDLNIDFNACASIVRQGNGQLRLRPTLTAGQVSSASTGISGTVVDSVTMMPITGEVQVAVQQADSTGVGRIVMQAAAGSNGSFNFCPLPSGTYDIVAVATSDADISFGPTALLGVPAGSSVGNIPLIADSLSMGPATISGEATSTTGSAGVSVDVGLSALQTIDVSGAMRQLNIPLQGDSTPVIATETGATCPANTFCKMYTLIVPAANPSFGTFMMGGGTMFSTPAAGDVLFSIEGRAFTPMSGGTPNCSPSFVLINMDSTDMPLKVTPATTTAAKRMDFVGCTM